MSPLDLLPPILGVLAVTAAASLALLPLASGRRAPATLEPADDPQAQRQHLYRQVLELEFDYQTGKLARDDLALLTGQLLARAATLMHAEVGGESIEEQVEREIAAARRAFAAAGTRPRAATFDAQPSGEMGGAGGAALPPRERVAPPSRGEGGRGDRGDRGTP